MEGRGVERNARQLAREAFRSRADCAERLGLRRASTHYINASYAPTTPSPALSSLAEE